jgi:hypothetical protein
MAYANFLKELCTVYSIEQLPDATTGMMTETEVALYSDIKCLKEDISYQNRFASDKDGVRYTDVFYTSFLPNAQDITEKYRVLHEGNRYKVIQAVNPVRKGHHTEIYTEYIK